MIENKNLGMPTWISRSALKCLKELSLSYLRISALRRSKTSWNYAKEANIRIKLVIKLDMQAQLSTELSRTATFRLVISQKLERVSGFIGLSKKIRGKLFNLWRQFLRWESYCKAWLDWNLRNVQKGWTLTHKWMPILCNTDECSSISWC